MPRTRHISDFMAKALRVTLTFALTFSMTFQFQQLAFAEGETNPQPASGTAPYGVDPAGSPTATEADGITDITVYEVDATQTTSKRAVRSVIQTAQEALGQSSAKQSYTPQLKQRKGTMSFAVEASVTQGGVTQTQDASGLVNWMFEQDGAYTTEWVNKTTNQQTATIDPNTGVITATGKLDDSVTVVCAIKSEYTTQVAPSFVEQYGSQPFLARFRVDLVNQSEPFVTHIEILDDAGNPINAAQGLVLPEQVQTYALQAKVEVSDPNGGLKTFYVSRDDSLKEQVRAAFNDNELELDLMWSTDDPASIDPSSGLLAPNGAFEFLVHAQATTAPQGQAVATSSIRVTRPVSAVQSVDILDANGQLVSDGAVELGANEGGYAFQALVGILDASGATAEFTVTADSGLSTQTGGRFADLVWSVDAEGMAAGATINPTTGAFTMGEATQAVVTVTYADASTQQPPSASVLVTKAAADKPYVESIEILDEGGKPIEGGTLTVPAATTEYGFQAKVVVVGLDGEGSRELIVTAENGLAAQTEGKLTNLLWGLATEDEAAGAKIDPATGKLSLAGVNSVAVSVGAAEAAPGQEPATASVRVLREGASEPYIESIELLKTDNTPFGDETEFTLDPGAEEYTFHAKVTIVSPNTARNGDQGEGEEASGSEGGSPASGKREYTVTPENGLAAQTNNAFADLAWSVRPDSDGATVEAGAFKLGEGDMYVVSASSIQGEPGKGDPSGSVGGSITVKRSSEPKQDPYVESVEILKEDGSSFGAEEVLLLPVDEDSIYKLGVRVVMIDPASNTTTTYVKGESGWTANGAPIAVSNGDGGNADGATSSLSSASGTTLSSSSSTTPGGPSNPNSSSGSGASGEADAGSGSTSDSATGLPFVLEWTSTDNLVASVTNQGELTVHAKEMATIRVSATPGKDGTAATHSVNLNERPERGEEDGKLHVYLDYEAVPYGETAVMASYIWGVRNIEYITTWEESEDGGKTWVEVYNGGQQTLRKPTVEPYIGRMYRAMVEIVKDPDKQLEPEERIAYSNEVTLEVGEDKLRVELFVEHVPEGQPAVFEAVAHIPEAQKSEIGTLTYTWEESRDNGETWDQLARSKSLTHYTVMTDRQHMSSQFRVWVTGENGETAKSNRQMLAALADDDPSEGDGDADDGDGDGDNTGGGDGTGGGSGDKPDTPDEPDNPDNPDQPDNPSKDQDQDDPDQDKPNPVPASDQNNNQNNNQNNRPSREPTLSEEIDRDGPTHIQFNGQGATMSPLGNISMAKPEEPSPAQQQTQPEQPQTAEQERPELLIDPRVNQAVAEQRATEEAQRQAELDATPGAHWNPIYFVEERDLMKDNPFAPFVLPLVLALIAAGALEKYLRYREEKRPSTAAF